MRIWTVLKKEWGEPEISDLGAFTSLELAKKYCEAYAEEMEGDDDDTKYTIKWHGEGEMELKCDTTIFDRPYTYGHTFTIHPSCVIDSEDDFSF